MSGTEPSNTYAQTFARGLAVITSFDEGSRVLTLTDVAARTGVTRSTARRLLHTLVTLGYAATDGKHFSLTPKILDLGYAYLASSEIWRFAEADIQALAARVGESSSISVLDGHDIVYVLRVQTQRILKNSLNVGSRVPAHAISMGRIQLAMLPDRELRQYLDTVRLEPFTPWTITEPDRLRTALLRDRKQGWSMVYRELEEGIAGLAVPICAANGRVIAAANVSLAPVRLKQPGRQDDLIAALKETADTIQRRLIEGQVPV
ncbi:regulatory protein, IclR [Pseudooceanicola batsensis HTCC2597]|uniref:Regulatory protein, IclR n=1 Tax=Pseudooceanicola batsensis (strain ATCC BAA-863 / DSM 15984 / KCTC 12145 / HTCC2597) TaxID=252305 RepID=A3U0L5_PSEBH|nr:IclR family transcriptional regulator C-terminal domain-containing protein [Pseudooceanicola batsensis]EAQ02306.1 regulatory protein, IclR [Pseudooceanicola batsensis HTCC2597]